MAQNPKRVAETTTYDLLASSVGAGPFVGGTAFVVLALGQAYDAGTLGIVSVLYHHAF